MWNKRSTNITTRRIIYKNIPIDINEVEIQVSEKSNWIRISEYTPMDPKNPNEVHPQLKSNYDLTKLKKEIDALNEN